MSGVDIVYPAPEYELESMPEEVNAFTGKIVQITNYFNDPDYMEYQQVGILPD